MVYFLGQLPWADSTANSPAEVSCNSALHLFPWCISNVYTVLNRLSEPGAIIGRKGFVPLSPQKRLGVWRVWYWFMESGSIEIAAKERMVGWLCPSHLFDLPVCRLKVSVSELHPPLENTDGQIWPYSISETDGHMQIWSSCWHQKTNWLDLKPTAHKTTQSPEGL